MTGPRKLYTGEETALRGLLVLRLTALGGALLTILSIVFFERAKHDPGLAAVNPFAEDPYDAVGSFGIQVGFVCAGLAMLRAIRTDLKNDSLYNRYTYTLRSIAVAQLAIIVTILGNLTACVLNLNLWTGSNDGRWLVVQAAALLIVAVGYCWYLIRLAKRREVCSKNPLHQKQILPFVLLLVLLGVYPAGWRVGVSGAILSAAAGMMFLFFSLALLSKAMFPCPDVPERDLLDDLNGIYRDLSTRFDRTSRPPSTVERPSDAPGFKPIVAMLNLRSHTWRAVGLIGVIMGLVLAAAELSGGGGSPNVDQVLLVGGVFVALESAGVILGFGLLRRFLGLIRFENAKY